MSELPPTALAAPYASAFDHLRDELRLVFLRLQRYIARYGHRMVQADGRLSNLYVSFEEARSQLGGLESTAPVATREGWPDVAAAELAIASQREHIEARLAATAASGEAIALPIEELRQSFRLTDADVDALIAAAAPTLSVDLSRLYTFAWADFAVKLPSVGFLAELLEGPGAASVASGVVDPHAVLFRRRLLLTRDSSAFGTPTPHFHRGVLAADSVSSWLVGRAGPLPPMLSSAGRLWSPSEARPASAILGADAHLDRLRAALSRLGRPGGPTAIVLEGPVQSGRRSLVQALAAERSVGTLEMRAGDLRGQSLTDALAEAAREATLRRATLLVRLDELVDDGAWLTENAAAIRSVASRTGDGVVLLTLRPSAALLRQLDEPVLIVVPKAEPGVQRAVWAAAADGVVALSPDDIDVLVSKLDLAPGAIVAALRAAALADSGRSRRSATTGKGAALGVEAVLRAAHGRIEHALGELAERLSTTLDWSDAVLPKEVSDSLAEVIAAAKHRTTVYDRWGFRRKLSYGRGLSCLFSGPPGTGKTMMAGIIGRSVGADVYRIDLSRIASKWVGETEKNLARLFDEAEKAQVILLFDEADSLFSRRTSVQSANDRFANMEINFLLQRMEAYDGMTILTTNFEESIDVAFKRRIRYVVSFPMPNGDERAALWRSMLPAGAPVASDIDFAWLGERFTLSGGNIKNAAVRAAFYAASTGGVITEAHFVKAATAEAQTIGIAVRSDPT